MDAKRSAIYRAGSILACLLLAGWPAARAQQADPGGSSASESAASSIDGFAYNADSSSELEFVGTALAPRVVGEATVRVTRDKTEINTRLQRLPDAASLGPLSSYVAWVVTPEGRATNIGVLMIEGDRARLEAATPLSSFALIVTAEPHFAVSIPSKYIVARSLGKSVKGTKLLVPALAAREDYRALKPILRDKKAPVPLELEMARYAVAIAEAARAKELAPNAFEGARQSLKSAESAAIAKKFADHARVGEFARDAIRAGEDARAAAELRQSTAERAAQAAVIKEQEAAVAKLRDELGATRQRAQSAEEQLPNPAKRVALTVELLSRWFTLPAPSDSGLTLHIAEESFAKGTAELVPAMQQRLAVAAGVLLGIGKMSVSVTPSLLASSDIQKLTLSQQRARAVMEWFASMGVKAAIGNAAADAEASLALGPGVDLSISAGSFDASRPDAVSSGN